MALTLGAVTMRDAAYGSQSGQPAELIYFGGDTPNPLTPAASEAQYILPAWVRSNPGQVNPTADADAFVELLARYGVPRGVATTLDLETAVDPAWVNTFGAVLHQAGYRVWPYGSLKYIFQNPRLDGYFVADPTGVPHLTANSVATQWGFFGTYDLSTIVAGESLWNRQAAPVPAPKPPAPKPAPLPPGRRPPSGAITDPIVAVACSRNPTTQQLDVCMVGRSGRVWHKWHVPSGPDAGWNGPDVLTDSIW